MSRNYQEIVYNSGGGATPAAVTATGNSGPIGGGFGGYQYLRCQLNVTAASGTTPTLDVVLQDSLDGTNWNTFGTFTQKTAAGREVINVNPAKAESGTFQPLFSDRVRLLFTIGGTNPSFTFTVVVAAVAGY